MYIYGNSSLSSSYNEKYFRQIVEKIKTHALCSTTFFRKSCRLWDNVEKYGRARQATDDLIIRRTRVACWITQATHTLRTCNTYWFSTAIVTRRRLNIALYVHCVSYSLLPSFIKTEPNVTLSRLLQRRDVVASRFVDKLAQPMHTVSRASRS
jgi:hypothetical protein